MAVHSSRQRARELGLTFGGLTPGVNDAITDVPGVRVAYTTLTSGDGPLRVGHGPVRTGVTVILPHDGDLRRDAIFAGCHRLNGNGEMTGLEWVRESGLLTTPIAITNTHSVGVVRDAIVAWEVQRRAAGSVFWSLPVVAETYDGALNDINGFHVRTEHVIDALDAALAAAAGAPIATGNVGGGTGMICHGFKGGTGSASRRMDPERAPWTVGVLVQANHGQRSRLCVNGVPIGEALSADEVALPGVSLLSDAIPPAVPSQGSGSIIVIIATDAPLLPTQLDRLAQRAALGIGRTGGLGENGSGDLILAFSTANHVRGDDTEAVPPLTGQAQYVSSPYVSGLFAAVVEATEAAIVDALLSATTMVGRDGITAHPLPIGRLIQELEKFGRPVRMAGGPTVTQ
jgi:D-aminopeptidase